MDPWMKDVWWTLVLRGVCAMIFGVLTFVWPIASLFALILLFGAYALIDGVFSLVLAARASRVGERAWPYVLGGLAGIGAAIAAMLWPGLTAYALLIVIASWAIVTGIFEIVAAIRLRKVIEGEWFLGLAGVLSIAFGVLLVLFPGAGVLSVLWIIGSFAFVLGVVLLMLGLKVRKATPRMPAAV
jgi:uncharacterized membrane protein HdeD (DUF308 family)